MLSQFKLQEINNITGNSGLQVTEYIVYSIQKLKKNFWEKIKSKKFSAVSLFNHSELVFQIFHIYSSLIIILHSYGA